MAKIAHATLKVPCHRCPLHTLGIFRAFKADELDFVSRFKTGELKVEAGGSVINEGTNSAHFYTVLSGWAIRYKTLENGDRQILNVALPGDMIGLQSAVLTICNTASRR